MISALVAYLHAVAHAPLARSQHAAAGAESGAAAGAAAGAGPAGEGTEGKTAGGASAAQGAAEAAGAAGAAAADHTRGTEEAHLFTFELWAPGGQDIVKAVLEAGIQELEGKAGLRRLKVVAIAG